jgi:PleD family two-component response regulator
MINPEPIQIGKNIDTETKQEPGADLDYIRRESRPRVLIVDDDLDFIEMLKLILRHAGFDVAGAIDSNSALEKCAEVNPDVILLDLMIPGVDGWGIYQILHGHPSSWFLQAATGIMRSAAWKWGSMIIFPNHFITPRSLPGSTGFCSVLRRRNL